MQNKVNCIMIHQYIRSISKMQTDLLQYECDQICQKGLIYAESQFYHTAHFLLPFDESINRLTVYICIIARYK